MYIKLFGKDIKEFRGIDISGDIIFFNNCIYDSDKGITSNALII